MKRNPSLRMKFEGNTDNIGSAKYNIGLSEKRATSVKGYFVKKGINPKRITTVGYGFTRPIATNSIPKGRALNRRTNLKPMP